MSLLRATATLAALLLARTIAWAEAPLDMGAADRALLQLADADAAVREEGTAKLIAMGPRLRPWVEERIADTGDAEVRARLDQVLEEIQCETLRTAQLQRVGRFGGHHGTRFCRFSPDGAIVVTAGEDARMRWFRASDLTEVASFEIAFDTDSPRAFSFSADARQLLVGDTTGALTLFDVAGRRVRAQFPLGKEEPVAYCALDPSGRMAVGRCRRGPLRIWDVESGTASDVPDLDGDADRAYFADDVTISPKGDLLAYHGRSAAHLFRLPSLEEVPSLPARGPLEGHTEPGFQFSSDGSVVVFGNGNGKLFAWSVADTKGLREFSDVRTYVLAGCSIWLVTEKGDLCVASTVDVSPPVAVGHAPARWDGLARSADGSRVLASDGAVWDVETRSRVASWNGTIDEWIWIDADANGAVLREGTRLQVVSLRDAKVLAEERVASFGPWGDISPDGSRLAVASWDGGFVLIDRASGSKRRLDPHAGAVRCASVTLDGRRIATGAHDGTVRIHDVASGRLLQTWGVPWQTVYDVVWSPDGRWLAACGRHLPEHQNQIGGCELRLLDVESGCEVESCRTGEGFLFSSPTAGFSHDSTYLVVGLEKEVRVWDLAAGKQVLSTPAKRGDFGIASRADRVVIRAEPSRSISLSDGSSVTSLPIQNFDDASYALRLSPDGRYLVVQAWARHGGPSLQLWDVAAGRPIHASGFGEMGTAAFSPDGTYVVVEERTKEASKLSVRLAESWAEAGAVALPLEDSSLRGRLAAALVGWSPSIQRLTFSASGETLFSVDRQGALGLWNFAHGCPRLAGTLHVPGDWSPEVLAGTGCVLGREEGEAVLWRLDLGE